MRVLDCAPISDGAAAVVICPLEYAKRHTDSFVKVSAVTQASDTLALFQRSTITSFEATQIAAQRAYEIAGIKPSDISVAEIHDNYTPAGIMAMEDFGFFKKGTAGRAILNGEVIIGGGNLRLTHRED